MAGEHGGGVKVSEGRCGSRISKIVGRDVDGLHGGDRTLLGRGDALLQLTHFGGQVRLVADGRGHTTEQRGDLGTGLGKAEDIVDEEQRIGTFLVAEMLGDREAGQRDAETCPWRLGHLPIDKGSFALIEVVDIDDARLLELMPEIVAFAGALADAGKHGETAMLLCDVVDEFLNDDGLSDAGPAEQSDLATLKKGLNEVDDLDPGLEHLFRRRLLIERGSLPMDGHVLLGVDRAKLVDRLAENVQHAAERLAPHGNGDARAGVDRLHATNHAFGRNHGDAADAAFAEVLLNLHHDVERAGHHKAFADDAERLKDRRHTRLFELDVNGRAADADYFAYILCHKSLFSLGWSRSAPVTERPRRSQSR